MVFRMKLTYSENEKILDLKYIPTKSIGYNLPPGLNEIIDIISMLNSLLPEDVKVNFTRNDI